MSAVGLRHQQAIACADASAIPAWTTCPRLAFLPWQPVWLAGVSSRLAGLALMVGVSAAIPFLGEALPRTEARAVGVAFLLSPATTSLAIVFVGALLLEVMITLDLLGAPAAPSGAPHESESNGTGP